jgi:uncharacterized protein YbbK (DUF523 family)
LKETKTQSCKLSPASAPVIVSACLLGLPTRYDGKPPEGIVIPERFTGRLLVPVCPEQLGGLPTPRPPQEFRGGAGPEVLGGTARLVNAEGVDVTENFLRGAEIACEIAKLTGATEALLKDGSPSCGLSRIVIDGKETTGSGVTAAALQKLGLRLVPCG